MARERLSPKENRRHWNKEISTLVNEVHVDPLVDDLIRCRDLGIDYNNLQGHRYGEKSDIKLKLDYVEQAVGLGIYTCFAA